MSAPCVVLGSEVGHGLGTVTRLPPDEWGIRRGRWQQRTLATEDVHNGTRPPLSAAYVESSASTDSRNSRSHEARCCVCCLCAAGCGGAQIWS